MKDEIRKCLRMEETTGDKGNGYLKKADYFNLAVLDE